MNGRVNCCEDDSTVAEESARKAVACGFELKDLSYDKKLMCHIAVSYGRMCCGVLEGSAGVRSFLLNGECIHNLSSCIDDAKSSELVICKLTKQYANQFITLSTELESTNFRIEQVAGVDTSDMTSVVCFLKRYQNKLQNLKLRHFADFVPQNVIDSYHSGSFHIFGELREVTTVFIKIDTYAYHSCSDLMLLEGYFNMATKALKEEGGYLRQFIVDDKGCVLIALWGTPNTSYDSNSERALNFAARVLEGSRPLGHSCSAGISAGTVYYGSIGSVLRRDIVAMGSSVNLAARLMSKANGRIIMCPDVFEGLSIDHRQRMHQIEPMQLKGYSDPIVPYALKADYMTYALLQYGALSPEKCYLAKRDAMVQSNLDPDIVSYMAATLEKVENNYMVVKELWMTMADKMNTSNNCLASSEEYNQICRVGRYDVEVIVIEGEKCCGKSEIARKFQTLAENHKLRTYTVIVEESDSTVPYSTLVKVFLALLNCSTADKDHKEGVMKRLLCTTFPQVEKNDVLLNEYFDQLSLIVQSASSASANILDLNSVCACPLRMRLYSCVGTDEVLMSVIVSLMELVPTALIVENFHFSDLVSKSKLMSVRKLKVPAAILFTQRTFSLDEGFADDDQGPNRKCQCGPVCVCQYKTRFNRYGKVFASAHVHIQETITPSKPQKKLMHVRRFKLGPLSLQQVWKVTDLVINSDGGKRMSEADFDKLVTVIRSLSEGNPHWVYAYAKFAKGQNGQIVEELQNLISDDGSTSSWARTSSSSRSPSPTQTSADSPPMIGKKSYLKKHVLGVMNSLTAIQSTALKFASVLGYEFSSELLSAFLPPQSQDSLNHTLSLLETLMLIQRSTFTDLISFRFVTPQVRQIVYDLVPPRYTSQICICPEFFW